VIGREIKEKLSPFDLIVETTPAKEAMKMNELNVKIFNIRQKRPEDLGYKLDEMNDFLKKNQHVYIFCNPIHYYKIKSIPPEKWHGIIQEIPI